MELLAEPLTSEAFAPYGDVITVPTRERRRYFHDALGDSRAEARLTCWISRIPPTPSLPLRCEIMEHHPCSTQTFILMSMSRFLVAVTSAGSDGAPDPRHLRAFVGSSGQGLTYRANVWHHGMVALDEPALFVVIGWKGGGPLDEKFVPLSEAVTISVPPNPEAHP